MCHSSLRISRAAHERDRHLELEVATCVGGVLSPLLANIALSVLDEHFAQAWQAMGDATQRYRHRKRGGGTWRLIRYADDFVVMVFGAREHAEALKAEAAQMLAPIGLRLSQAKTTIAHIDEGFDFLGFRIKRAVRKARTAATSTVDFRTFSCCAGE